MFHTQRMTIISQQPLFTRLVIDCKQRIHEHDNAFQRLGPHGSVFVRGVELHVTHMRFRLHLDSINGSAPCVCEATSMNHAFRADVFFICNISIGVQNTRIGIEESLATCLLRVISKSKITPFIGALYCQK